jgi:hypothetical protein
MSEFPAIEDMIAKGQLDRGLARALGQLGGAISDVHDEVRVVASRSALQQTSLVQPGVIMPNASNTVLPPAAPNIIMTERGGGGAKTVIGLGLGIALGALLFGSCQDITDRESPSRSIADQFAQTDADACRVVGGNIGVTCPGVETPVTDSSVPTDGTVTTEPQGNGRSMLTDAPFVTCYPITPDPGTQNARELCMDGMAQTAVAQPDGSTSATLQLGMYGRTSVSVVTEEGFTYPERQSLLPISEWFSANPDLCTEVAGHLKLAQTNNDGTQTVIAGANTAVAGAPKITGIFDSITGKPTQLVCDFANIQSAEQAPGA